jgi:hypothetical protein
MRPIFRIMAALAVGVCTVGTVSTSKNAAAQTPATNSKNGLRPASSFTDITDKRARSIALFEEAGKVLQHPRCVNCHPAGDRPRQTDNRRLHIPLVVRGADGFGAPGMRCKTCHHDTNFDRAGVPGNDHWHLAPTSMTWEGRSLGQICEQLKDPARNGGRGLAGIVHHVTTDTLVKWAWAPGGNRTPAPGTDAEFGELLQAWAETGAFCPSP